MVITENQNDMWRRTCRKFTIIGKNQDNRDIASTLIKLYPDCKIQKIDWGSHLNSSILNKINAFCPWLLITVNLAGFELLTLRKGILYNLLDCKSLHIMTQPRLINECLLGKPLSISMFFFCVGENYCAYLRKTYPDIPFLKVIKPLLLEGVRDLGRQDWLNEVLRETINQIQEEVGLIIKPVDF